MQTPLPFPIARDSHGSLSRSALHCECNAHGRMCKTPLTCERDRGDGAEASGGSDQLLPRFLGQPSQLISC